MGRVEASHLHIDNISFNLNHDLFMEMFGTEFEAEIYKGAYKGNNVIWPKCMIEEVIVDEPKDWSCLHSSIKLDEGETRINIPNHTFDDPRLIEEIANKLLDHANYHRQKELLK